MKAALLVDKKVGQLDSSVDWTVCQLDSSVDCSAVLSGTGSNTSWLVIDL